MNSLSDARYAPAYYAQQATAEAILTAYLDSLCTPLIGIIPLRERLRLREETAFHLERLTNASTLEGLPPPQAAQRAIDKYGPAPEVAQHFLDAWYAYYPPGRLSRRLGLGIVTAMVWFGLATLLVTMLMQYRVYQPEMRPMEPIGIAALIRRGLPPSLSALEVNPLFFALWSLMLIAPVPAGWATGSRVLVRSARAVWQAQTVLTLYTFTLGVHLLPTTEGLALALFQLFYWLPVGCFSAYLAAQVTIRRRCRMLLDEEAQDEP